MPNKNDTRRGTGESAFPDDGLLRRQATETLAWWEDFCAELAEKQVQAEVQVRRMVRGSIFTDLEFDRLEELSQAVARQQMVLEEARIAWQDYRFVIEAATGAMQQFGAGMSSALAQAAAGEMSFGQAMKRVVADVIMTLGKEAMVRGAMEIAMAIASLAMLDAKGAALHGTAAAKFLAVGAMASTVGGSLMKGAGPAGAGAGAGPGAGGGAGERQRNAGRGGAGGNTYVINISGPMDGRSVAAAVSDAINQKERYAT